MEKAFVNPKHVHNFELVKGFLGEIFCSRRLAHRERGKPLVLGGPHCPTSGAHLHPTARHIRIERGEQKISRFLASVLSLRQIQILCET